MNAPLVTHPKKSKGISSISLTILGDLQLASATSAASYSVMLGIKKGNKVTYAKPVRLGAITYDAATHRVTINLAKATTGPMQVSVLPGRVIDASGAAAPKFSTLVK